MSTNERVMSLGDAVATPKALYPAPAHTSWAVLEDLMLLVKVPRAHYEEVDVAVDEVLGDVVVPAQIRVHLVLVQQREEVGDELGGVSVVHCGEDWVVARHE